MSEDQEFCLRWNDFHSSFHVSLEALRGDESFTDVTLSCSGQLFKAHRIILSACSAHFRDILKEVSPQQHPVIILPTVDRDVMRAILEFIYQGQVNVRQARLGAFLQVAETFSIQGLADEQTKRNASKTPERPRAPDAGHTPSKRRRLEQQQQPQPQSQSQRQPQPQPQPRQPAPPAVSAPVPPLSEKGPGLELALKAEPDPVLDGLEDMLEPQPDLPPLDGSEQDAHGQMPVGKYEDTGGTQASSDGLAAAIVATAMCQPAGGYRSLVRDYFTGSGQDRLCRLCGHLLRLNRQLSTSGMWRHMRVRHPELVPAEWTGGGRAEPLSGPGGAGSVRGDLGAPGAPARGREMQGRSLSPLQGGGGYSAARAASMPSIDASPFPDDRKHSLPDEGGGSELLLCSGDGGRVPGTSRPRGLAAVMLPEERQQQQPPASPLPSSDSNKIPKVPLHTPGTGGAPGDRHCGGRQRRPEPPGYTPLTWGGGSINSNNLGGPAAGGGDGRRAEDSAAGPESDGFFRSLVMSSAAGRPWS